MENLNHLEEPSNISEVSTETAKENLAKLLEKKNVWQKNLEIKSYSAEDYLNEFRARDIDIKPSVLKTLLRDKSINIPTSSVSLVLCKLTDIGLKNVKTHIERMREHLKDEELAKAESEATNPNSYWNNTERDITPKRIQRALIEFGLKAVPAQVIPELELTLWQKEKDQIHQIVKGSHANYLFVVENPNEIELFTGGIDKVPRMGGLEFSLGNISEDLQYEDKYIIVQKA